MSDIVKSNTSLRLFKVTDGDLEYRTYR